VEADSDSDEGDKRIVDGISDEELEDEIDEFHATRDKVMLGEDVLDDDDDSDDDDADSEEDDAEDAVLGIDADTDSDDDDGDDDEDDVNSVGGSDAGDSDAEDEKISTGWGKSRKEFYNQDFVDPDFDYDEQQEEDAKEEEEEALRLQAMQVAELDEDDYGLPFGGLGNQADQSKKKSKKKGDKSQTDMVAELDNELDTIGMGGLASAAVETIGRDLTHMSTEDRLVQLAQQAPELLDLCEEYTGKTAEQADLLEPILARVELGAHGMSADGVAYFTLRQRVVTNYLLNVAYYLYLRGLGRPTAEIAAHPCIKRIVHARKIFADLEPLHARMCDELESAQAEGTFSFDGPTEENAAVNDEDDEEEQEAAAAAGNPETDSDGSIEQEIMSKKANKGKGGGKGSKKKKKAKKGRASAETTYSEVSFEDAQKERKAVGKAAKKDAKRRRKAATDFGETKDGDDDLGEAVAERKKAKKAAKAERAAAKDAAAAAASEFSLDDYGLGGLDGEGANAEDAVADAYYQAIVAAKEKKKTTKAAGFSDGFDAGNADDTEENRSITWAMKSNKGLTPSRKKEVRNPRVRNRNQHKKRTKQRGGAVQKVRTEKEKYRGEEFGIKANIIKSVKLK